MSYYPFLMGIHFSEVRGTNYKFYKRIFSRETGQRNRFFRAVQCEKHCCGCLVLFFRICVLLFVSFIRLSTQSYGFKTVHKHIHSLWRIVPNSPFTSFSFNPRVRLQNLTHVDSWDMSRIKLCRKNLLKKQIFIAILAKKKKIHKKMLSDTYTCKYRKYIKNNKFSKVFEEERQRRPSRRPQISQRSQK